MTVRYLLRGQVTFLRSNGFDVWTITSPGPDLDRFLKREPVPVVALPMSRRIRPLADLAALVRLYRILRRLRPRLINASTPKAGVLGMIAAWIARIPIRVYLVRGLPAETARGPRGLLLKGAERIASALAHHVVCVGPSLRRRCLELGLAPAAKTIVLGSGTSNGIDLQRFLPRSRLQSEAARLRRRLAIPDGSPVIGFVGRLTRDKGLEDLAAAFFDGVVDRFPDCRLLLLGGFEEGDPVSESTRRRLQDDSRVATTGFVSDPAPYYALMDVLAFPSYREGFPNAPLEAAAAEVPTVGYEATGTSDAVDSGVTGELVPPGDRQGLADALSDYLQNDDLRRSHGAAGRARVARHFEQRKVWEAWAAWYTDLLGPPAP